MDEFDDLLKEKLDMMNPDRVDRELFLDAISKVESSGGKNFNHPEMTSGIHTGQSAIGSYGLMPNTVKEIVKRAELQGTATSPMKELVNREPQAIKTELEVNPELEQQLASELAKRVLKKYKDPEMAAYSWNQGTNLRPTDIVDRDYKNSEYVKRFRKLHKLLGGS